MEAPEKLYFGEVDKGILDIYSNRDSNDEIEYTRTEVFIDKAEKWLDEHIFDYVYAKEWGQGVGIEGELFDDFRNAMKGE